MNMRITERMRLVNDEILENQVTVDDPEYLTKPWTWTWMYSAGPATRSRNTCARTTATRGSAQRYQRLKVN